MVTKVVLVCCTGYIFVHWTQLLETLKFRKFVHTNLPQVGFELGSLGPQAGVLPIEPPLLVDFKKIEGLAYIIVQTILLANKQGWLNWLHAGLQSQRSEFKPHLGQISVNKFSELD